MDHLGHARTGTGLRGFALSPGVLRPPLRRHRDSQPGGLPAAPELVVVNLIALLEKLAALIPRSHVNLVLYHGVLASHARWRPRIEPTDPATGGHSISPDPSEGTRPAPRARPRHWAWAQLMQRAFGVDVLACPR